MVTLLKLGIRWILVLLACIVTGFTLMVGSALIPQQPIMENLLRSEELSSNKTGRFISDSLDQVYYTESIMTMLACTMDRERPVESALESRTYTLQKFMMDPVTDYHHFIKKGVAGMKEADYNRYWHGYLVTLRPALYFFDLFHIRWYSYTAFTVLIIVMLAQIKNRYGWSIMLPFLVLFLHTEWYKAYVPFSLDQNKVYFIMMISSIILMASKKLYLSQKALPLFFIVVGACTSFLDFLTAPVLTIGVPLIILLLKRGSDTPRVQLKILLICSIAWCFGYAGMWASKWLLCAMFTDCQVYDMVKGSLKERSIGSFEFDFVRFCRNMLYPIPSYGYTWWIYVSTTLLLTLGSSLTYLFVRYRESALNNIGYFIIMLYPAVWFLATRQHTIIHLVFTRRIIEVLILGYGIFVIKTLKEAFAAMR